MNKRRTPFPVKAVAIDLDGTMLDTIEDLAHAVNDTLRDLSLPTLELSLVRTFVGKGLQNLVERSLTASRNRTPEPALLAKTMPIYEANYDRLNGQTTTVYPGVREGLDALASAGYPLACITNKSKRFTEPLLDRIGFARYFSLVLSGDSLVRRKPDPLPLTHAAGHFGVAPPELLMIGDSVNDAEAARAAGCPVFCVSYGYNEGADVRTLDVDAIVSTLLEASTLIQRSPA